MPLPTLQDPHSPRRRLLIVDDSSTFRSLLAWRLTRAYAVVEAGRRAEALALLESEPIHLVLLDYCLPDGNGLDLLSILKQRLPTLPVLFMTAFGSETIAQEAFRRGARDYLAKPFDLRELEARVVWILETCSQGKERRQPLPFQFVDGIPLPHPMTSTGCPPAGFWVAVRHLQTCYFEDHSRDRLARLAGMTRRAFTRCFQETFGKEWKAYLAELRFQKAADLLSRSSLSVTEIACQVGYHDLTHFERLFKRHTGLTPRAYLKSRQ